MNPHLPETEEQEDALPLSGMQHLAFCPRQWALIHLEQRWAENRLTAAGRLLHEKANLPGQTRRHDLRTVRGMPLASRRLQLTGRADVVEFTPEPYPVEYKRGKRKPTDCDLVQLCVQALCLEEMLNCPVPKGAIFYGEPRRRIDRGRVLATLARSNRVTRTRNAPSLSNAGDTRRMLQTTLPKLLSGRYMPAAGNRWQQNTRAVGDHAAATSSTAGALSQCASC